MTFYIILLVIKTDRMCVQSEPGKYRTVRSLLYEKKTANKKKILPSSELFETAPIKEWKLATRVRLHGANR